MPIFRTKRTRADALFSEYIRARDRCCQHCGATGRRLECAHLFSRRHWATRHSIDNALALCFQCHGYFTRHETEWRAWLEQRFGVQAMARLELRSRAIAKKNAADEALRVQWLRALIKKQQEETADDLVSNRGA